MTGANQYGIRIRARVVWRIPKARRREYWAALRARLYKLAGSRGSQAMHALDLDRPVIDPVIGRRARRKARKQFARWTGRRA